MCCYIYVSMYIVKSITCLGCWRSWARWCGQYGKWNIGMRNVSEIGNDLFKRCEDGKSIESIKRIINPVKHIISELLGDCWCLEFIKRAFEGPLYSLSLISNVEVPTSYAFEWSRPCIKSSRMGNIYHPQRGLQTVCKNQYLLVFIPPQSHLLHPLPCVWPLWLCGEMLRNFGMNRKSSLGHNFVDFGHKLREWEDRLCEFIAWFMAG